MLRNAHRLLCCGDGGARTGSLKWLLRFRHLLYWEMWRGGCRRLGVPGRCVCGGTSGRVMKKVTCKESKSLLLSKGPR